MKLEFLNFTDSTATDDWLPTSDGKKTEAIQGDVESVYVAMKWSDQGWGNRKGEVKVALMRDDKEIASESLFGKAEHEQKS
jgi:hypothetical protein